jgi:hypothetical protein
MLEPIRGSSLDYISMLLQQVLLLPMNRTMMRSRLALLGIGFPEQVKRVATGNIYAVVVGALGNKCHTVEFAIKGKDKPSLNVLKQSTQTKWLFLRISLMRVF